MRRRHRDRETIDRCSAGKIPTELFHDPSSRRLRANLRWYRRLSESTYLSCNCPKCRWYLRRGTMSPFLGGRHQSSHVLPTSIGRQRVHPRIGRMSLCKYLFHTRPKCHCRLHPTAIEIQLLHARLCLVHQGKEFGGMFHGKSSLSCHRVTKGKSNTWKTRDPPGAESHKESEREFLGPLGRPSTSSGRKLSNQHNPGWRLNLTSVVHYSCSILPRRNSQIIRPGIDADFPGRDGVLR